MARKRVKPKTKSGKLFRYVYALDRPRAKRQRAAVRRQEFVRKVKTNPKRKAKRRNPRAAGAQQTLAAARRLSREFHGVDTEVLELTPRERQPLPKHVTYLGDVDDLTYAPDRHSPLKSFRWRHQAGDRGPFRRPAKYKPLLVADPRTKQPTVIMGRSPMRATRKGLVG